MNHDRFNFPGGYPGTPRLPAEHPGTVRYHGCDIIENVRLASNPLRLGERLIRTGFEVFYNGFNPIPAQPFFLAVADARRAIDLLVQAQTIDAWWRLAHETRLEAFAGGSLLYRGYKITQRIVCSGDDPKDWTYTRGFEAFHPVPYDFKPLLPAQHYFESLTEAMEAVDLHLDGSDFNPAFWMLPGMAALDGMIRHGSTMRAMQRQRETTLMNDPGPKAALDLTTPASEDEEQGAEPALEVENDYRGFIYLVYAEEALGGDLMTRIWSSVQELVLADLPGAVTLATVRAVVDAYYVGLDRGVSGENLPGATGQTAEDAGNGRL